MSTKYFLLLLPVSFAVEIVSGTTTVLASSTVQTSGQSETLTTIPSSYLPSVNTVSRSHTPVTRTVQPTSTLSATSSSPVKPHVSGTLAVQPTSTISASSSSPASPLTNVPQSTKQTTTSDLSAKAKSIGGLEIMGFAILTILAIIIIAFAIYYFFFRKEMYPEHLNGQVPAEVGITHKGFVGDAESPTKAALEPEVKVATGPEVTPQVKGNEEPEDSAL